MSIHMTFKVVCGWMWLAPIYALLPQASELPEIPSAIKPVVKLSWNGPKADDGSPTLSLRFVGPLHLPKDRTILADADCREALKIKGVTSVGAITIPDLTNSQVEILSQFPELRWMSVSSASITDRCTETLARVPRLELISLYRSPISDAGVARLATLKHLRILDLSHTKFQGTETSKLRLFAALEELDCSKSPVDDRLCQEVIHCTSLKTLQLNATKVTDEGVSMLIKCRNLEGLYLSDLPQLTIASFRHVILLPNLRVLSVRGCKVEDNWLDLIPAGSSIRDLHLKHDAPFTMAAINRLRKRNPTMKIYHGRPVKPKAKTEITGLGSDATPAGWHRFSVPVGA